MMQHPVQGTKFIQRKTEFLALVEIYRKLKPKRVVEVGSYKGGTLWFWLKYAAPGGQVVSVDRLNVAYLPRWKRWAMRGVTLQAVEGDSTDRLIVERVESIFPQGIDFVFIDGGHDYETVKADFENYAKMVKPGGIAALHDILVSDEHPDYGVPRFYNELKDEGYRTLELLSKPAQVGMGIGVVYL